MYLLVDSGSTKADWVLYDHQRADFYISGGINPSTQKSEYIQNQIATIATKLPHIPKKIFFYGAGTTSEHAKRDLVSFFLNYFPTTELAINSDLLAAGRSLCNDKEAIIGILGTGSHAALCDGHQIKHQLPALGYILGDEGSGNHLGKEILKMYYNQKLDEELKSALEIKHPELQSDFIYQLYHSPNPSSTLAQFAEFVVKNKNHITCNQIIMNCFEQFINSKLLVYKDKSQLPVHLCGSIAFYLKDEIELVLSKFRFKLGECIQKPIHKLLEYHKRELKMKSEK